MLRILSGARRSTARHLTLLVACSALAACSAPRPIGPQPLPPEIARPTSSVHYRDYDSADDLAAALRWTERAPVLVSAHRGGPTPGFPENAIETFENALNFAPTLIEMDVRATADGRLVLLHDETLDRTTTGTGRLDTTPFVAVRALRLLADDGTLTSYRVPTLDEALAWAEGRAVLVLDAKSDVEPRALVEAVRRLRAEDRVVVITYSAESVATYRRIAPELVLSISAGTPAEARAALAASDPDRVIAFVGVGAADPATVAVFHAAGVRVQAGAFGAIDEAAEAPGGWTAYRALLDAGVDTIASDNVPAAAIAAQQASMRR